MNQKADAREIERVALPELNELSEEENDGLHVGGTEQFKALGEKIGGEQAETADVFRVEVRSREEHRVEAGELEEMSARELRLQTRHDFAGVFHELVDLQELRVRARGCAYAVRNAEVDEENELVEE